jgi:hypothetical protein
MGLSDAPFKSRDNKNTRTTRATPSSLPQAARLQTNKQKRRGRAARRGVVAMLRARARWRGRRGLRKPRRRTSRSHSSSVKMSPCRTGPRTLRTMVRSLSSRNSTRTCARERGAGGGRGWVAADAGARKSPPKKPPRHAPASRCPWTPCGRAPCAQKRRQRRRVTRTARRATKERVGGDGAAAAKGAETSRTRAAAACRRQANGLRKR